MGIPTNYRERERIRRQQQRWFQSRVGIDGDSYGGTGLTDSPRRRPRFSPVSGLMGIPTSCQLSAACFGRHRFSPVSGLMGIPTVRIAGDYGYRQSCVQFQSRVGIDGDSYRA